MAQINQNSVAHADTSIDTQKQNRPRKAWRQVLQESAPLVLPVAHDALTARLIELAGYPAYQIGGFALVGSRFAYRMKRENRRISHDPNYVEARMPVKQG